MVNSMESESITSQTLVNYTRVSSKIIIWKVKALWFGLMNQGMKVISKLARGMVKAHNILRTETTTSVNGKMTYSMAQEFCIM